MNTKIYLIPGLGADARLYTHQLKMLSNAIVLEHMTPLPGEDMKGYVQRLSKQIDTSAPFTLIGTSLGGIISMELSRIVHPEKVILISSVKHRGELPLWLRAMRSAPIHRVLSGRNYMRISRLGLSRLTGRGDTEAAAIIRDMYLDTDPVFIEWAINEIISWQGGTDYRSDIIHIHGTADRLFSYKKAHGAILIPGGSHVMGLTKAEEVNRVLLDVLKK